MKRTLVYVVYHDQRDLVLEALSSIDIGSSDADCLVVNTSSSESAKIYLANVVPSHIPVMNCPGTLIQAIGAVYEACLDKYDFITRLDADDRFVTGGLKKLITFMSQRDDCAAAYGDWEIINETGQIRGSVIAPSPDAHQGFHGACTVFRTACLKQYDIKSYNISCQDGFCTYLYLRKNNLHIAKIDGVVFQYRRHGGNLSSARNRLWEARTTLLKVFIETFDQTKCILVDCSMNDIGAQDQEFLRKHCAIAKCGGGNYFRSEDSEPISIPAEVPLTNFFEKIEKNSGNKLLAVNIKKLGSEYFDGLIEVFAWSAVLQESAQVRYGTVFSRRIWMNNNVATQCVNLVEGATVPSFLEQPGLTYVDSTKNRNQFGVVTDFFLTDFIDRAAN